MNVLIYDAVKRAWIAIGFCVLCACDDSQRHSATSGTRADVLVASGLFTSFDAQFPAPLADGWKRPMLLASNDLLEQITGSPNSVLETPIVIEVFSFPTDRITEFEAWLRRTSVSVGVFSWRVLYYAPASDRPQLFDLVRTCDYEVKDGMLFNTNSKTNSPQPASGKGSPSGKGEPTNQ